MSKIEFADDLYGDSPSLIEKFGGCGLKGFCRACSWGYARHGNECEPGKWRVYVIGHDADEFWPLLANEANAVVDDFGSLRRVS